MIEWRNKIDWTLLTPEEKEKICLLVERGNVKQVGAAVQWSGRLNTVAVEKELQKIVDLFSPYTEKFESKVQKELNKALRDNPTLLHNPTEEAVWDKKLRDEFQANVAKGEAKAKAKLEAVPEIKKEEVAEVKEEEAVEVVKDETVEVKPAVKPRRGRPSTKTDNA